MSTNGKKDVDAGEELAAATPISLAIFSRGIRTGSDFACAMSALMADLASGRMNPAVGNAICNAGGKLLKAVEMSQKFGAACDTPGRKVLQLTDAEDPRKAAA